MTVIRAFIAIDLSPEIHHRLYEILDIFKTHSSNIPVRWVPVTNIHLTLKFLGDVSIANINLITSMVQTEVASHHQFEISIGGSGAFPNNRQPRVIWVGVEAPQELVAIQNGIDAAAARLGYAREERAFSPHLTLGRVSKNASSQDIKEISQILEKYRVGFLGATRVEKVNLYRSDLQPTGAEYTRIYSAGLLV